MSADVSSANGKKKVKKSANNVGNSSSSEIISSSLTTSKSQTNRIGPRVFKCVILGDGGVGKSGEFFEFLQQRKFDSFWRQIIELIKVEGFHPFLSFHLEIFLLPQSADLISQQHPHKKPSKHRIKSGDVENFHKIKMTTYRYHFHRS